MEEKNIHILRQEHIETDSLEIQIGDRFQLLDPDGTRANLKSSEVLYEKGQGIVLGRQVYRITGLMRFKDFQNKIKIGISTYWNEENKLIWDCRAEEFPVNDPDFSGLLKTLRLMPYHSFLDQHGYKLSDFITQR